MMDDNALSVIRWLIGLAGLCVVSLVVLVALGRDSVEAMTILGGTVATIVGAVAGVVVGQKLVGRPDDAQPAPLTVTGPDVFAADYGTENPEIDPADVLGDKRP